MAKTILELYQNPSAIANMRDGAGEFVGRYEAARNHGLMIQIYQQAIARRERLEEPELAAAT